MATEAGSIVYKISVNFSGLDTGLSTAKSKLNSFKNDVDKFDKSTANAGVSFANSVKNGFSSLADNGSRTISGIGSALTSTTAKLVGFTALTAGLTKTISSSVSGFADLESNIAVVATRTETGAAGMLKLKDAAIALGRDITLPGVSAKDASEAIGELAKRGFTLEQAITASKQVLQLARIENIAFAESATIVASAINTFGLSANDASKVVDGFENAASASGAKVEDLGLGMQQAGAVAKLAGLSFEDTATALAILAKNGIRGSDAGTTLKTALLRLSAPSGEAADQLAALGLSAFDSSGKLKPFRTIIDDVTKATANLTDEQRLGAVAQIFGTDAVRAGTIVLGAGTEQYDKFNAAIKKNGTTSKLAEAQNAGLKGTLDALKSSVETLFLQIGEKLQPTFNTLGKQFQKFIDDGGAEKISKVIEAIAKAVASAAGFIVDHIGVIQKLVVAYAAFKALAIGTSVVQGIVQFGTALLGASAQATVATAGMTTATTAASSSAAALGGSLKNLLLLGGGLPAFGAAVVVAGALVVDSFGKANKVLNDTEKAITSLGNLQTQQIVSAQDFNGAYSQLADVLIKTTAAENGSAEAIESVKLSRDKLAASTPDYVKTIVASIQAEKGAKEAQTQANDKYNESVATSGISSAQTIEASKQLVIANANQKKAQEEVNVAIDAGTKVSTNLTTVKDSLNNTTKAERDTLLANLTAIKQETEARGLSTVAIDGAINKIVQYVDTPVPEKKLEVNTIDAIKKTSGFQSLLEGLKGKTVDINAKDNASSVIDNIAGKLGQLARNVITNIQSQATSIPKNAAGTNYFGGGLTLVGEAGPELVSLPKASKIINAGELRGAVNKAGSSSGAANTVVVVPYSDFGPPSQERLREIGRMIKQAGTDQLSAMGATI